MGADRKRKIDTPGQVPRPEPGDATTTTGPSSPLDRLSATTPTFGNATTKLPDGAKTWWWRREIDSDGRLIGTLPVGIRRLQFVVRALLSRERRAPGLDVRDARPLRHYLRQAIREQVAQAVPPPAAVDPRAFERYRLACSRLPIDDRDQIVATVELGYSYNQLALAMGYSSTQAARSAAKRALLRLAEEMSRG